MIAVIADDFTGAAELGGVGLRYHLSVEVCTAISKDTKADLLIIATDARSQKKELAVQEMEKHTRELLALKPAMIFKKTDSVLRGHILAEILAQLSIAGFEKAVLVPANPALGRTIQNGCYYLHGEPVHQSSFSHDPEFAITSSAIEDMLHCNGYQVHIKKTNDALPPEGIIVGEASKTEDLQTWATRIDGKTLAAGASGFFAAILANRSSQKEQPFQHGRYKIPVDKPRLFVCGSTFNSSRDAIRQIQAQGGPVSYMPAEIAKSVQQGKYSYVKWGNEVVALVKKHGKAIVAIHPDTTNGFPVSPGQLRKKMAGLVHEVLQRSMIQELYVEGGATAWAVVKKSGLTRFFPVEEMAPGVVRMQTNDPELCVTVKPGSYAWPEGIWDF